MKKSNYSISFYQAQSIGSQNSAKQIVPLLIDLISPKSIVDVGCGIGTWLSVFRYHGIDKVVGIDGDYVNKEMLLIPKECFIPHDLTQPLSLKEKFDLVISLEVAEHLPARFASSFVDNLIKLGPVVVFSAAIPFQGGVAHVNEQWPEYWVELFKKQNYVVIDCLRNKLWNNTKIKPWYAQNMMIFVDEQYLPNYQKLVRERFPNDELVVYTRIHPQIWINAHQFHQQSLRKILKVLPLLIENKLRRTLLKVFTYINK